MLVELFVGNAGLHRCIEIARADLQNPVHPRDVDAHPALQRHDMAFQASATAKRDNRHLVSRADLDDLAYLMGRLSEGDGVRRCTGMIGGILAVLLAHRSAVERRSPKSWDSDAIAASRAAGATMAGIAISFL